MAALLGPWKPRFIHDERSKKLVRNIIEEAGFTAEETHFDVPKPRTSFPVGHLTTGVAFAFPWHRDVWYSAPNQQLNWWLPIFPARDDNAMSFDLDRFNRPVDNNSGDFDYYRNNIGRLTTAASVKQEAQVRPGAIDHTRRTSWWCCPPRARSCCSPARSCTAPRPNTSGLARYSVDFRTVHVPDVLAGKRRARSRTRTARAPRSATSSTSPTSPASTRPTCAPSTATRRRTRCSSSRPRRADPRGTAAIPVAAVPGQSPTTAAGLVSTAADVLQQRRDHGPVLVQGGQRGAGEVPELVDNHPGAEGSDVSAGGMGGRELPGGDLERAALPRLDDEHPIQRGDLRGGRGCRRGTTGGEHDLRRARPAASRQRWPRYRARAW